MQWLVQTLEVFLGKKLLITLTSAPFYSRVWLSVNQGELTKKCWGRGGDYNALVLN